MISERRGTTVHLLKHNAKPVPQRNQRRKHDMLTYKEFSHSQPAEEKKETVDAEMKNDDYMDVTNKLKGSKRNRTPVPTQ